MNTGGSSSSIAQNLRRQWSVRSENRSIIPGVGMTQRQISLQASSSCSGDNSSPFEFLILKKNKHSMQQSLIFFILFSFFMK